MDRNVIIDRIIRELQRQAQQGGQDHLAVAKGKDPDTFHIIGIIDVDRLAKAVKDEP